MAACYKGLPPHHCCEEGGTVTVLASVTCSAAGSSSPEPACTQASMNTLHISVTKMNTAAFLVSHSLLELGEESGKTSSVRGLVLGAKVGKWVT